MGLRSAAPGRWALLGAISLVLGARPLAAQVRGEIFGPGTTHYPIAIAPLELLGGGEPRLAQRFADVLAGDLALSGYFTVIDSRRLRQSGAWPGSGSGTADLESWAAAGALALVRGTFEQLSDQVRIEVHLLDVPQRQEVEARDGQPCGRRYTGGPGGVVRMAHRFADRILYCFTGEPGPFDSRIAFVSTRAGGFKEIFELGLEGGEPRQLTANRTINLSPAWSPDLRFLLFTSYKDRRPKLYLLDRASGQAKVISSAAGLNIGGAWSPDGRRIAVTREERGNSDIFLLDRDGRTVRRLTEHWAIDLSPTWSPDGRQIAFCSTRSGSPQIYVMGADGEGLRRITFTGSYNTDPAWSPRGNLVAYAGRVAGRFQIFVVPPHAGGSARQVTHDPGNSEDPAWSPDGRYLVYSSQRGSARHLYVTNLSGSPPRQLTRGKGDDSNPAWSARLQ